MPASDRMARAERSRSVRAVLASALPRTACSEVHTPWAMGLNRVARVQSAAMPMVPAPRKRTWELHSWVARSLMAWPAAGVALMVSSGTATPQQMSTPMRMAMPAVMPIR